MFPKRHAAKEQPRASLHEHSQSISLVLHIIHNISLNQMAKHVAAYQRNFLAQIACIKHMFPHRLVHSVIIMLRNQRRTDRNGSIHCRPFLLGINLVFYMHIVEYATEAAA